MSKSSDPDRFLYWLDEAAFRLLSPILKSAGFSLSSASLTPCQVLRAHDKKVCYATPSVWSRMCVRQGSWYRNSSREGMYMVVSAVRLPDAFAPYLDAMMEQSDFMPESLPDGNELQDIVDAPAYNEQKPDDWEKTSWWDTFSFKMLFSIFRFWKKEDNLKKHWLGQRANHANFVSKKRTVELDGEQVAYSVTDNASVCSSCVEFFNIVGPGSRKLVRSCPGAVIFGGAKRHVYYDLKPEKP